MEIISYIFKRILGDSIQSIKWENIKQKIKIKIWAYNRMLRVSQEAISMT